MEKRELIFENKALLNVILGDLKQYMPKLTPLKNAYEALEIGAFTDEIFTDLKKNGIRKVLEQFQTSLEAQLDKSGITNTNLRRVALDGSEAPKIELRNTYEALKNVNVEIYQFGPHRIKTLDLSEISFIDGNFKVGNPEAIAENHCRVYLNDSIDKEIFATLKKAKEALLELDLMAEKFKIPFGLGGSSLVDFFDETDGKMEIKPQSISYVKNLYLQQKAYNDREQNRLKKQEEIKEKARIELEEKQRMFREDPANKYYYETENLEH